MQTDEIIYGVTGQIVEMYPPEFSEGVPSVATCSVFEAGDSNDDTAEYSPTVTIDAVSTTVDAASGFGQTDRRVLNLAATTSIAVGRLYLLENSLGQRELVKVTSITGAASVTVQEPMKYDYASADTFKGVRMTFPVDATWVADESKILSHTDAAYRAVWSYTVNALTRKHYTYLRLVRQPLKTSITIYDIAEILPDIALAEAESQLGNQLKQAINAAFDRVRVDLLLADVQPDMVRDTEIVDELVRAKAIQITTNFHTPGARDGDTWALEKREDYEALFTRVTAGKLKVPVDTGADGATTTRDYSQMLFER